MTLPTPADDLFAALDQFTNTVYWPPAAAPRSQQHRPSPKPSTTPHPTAPATR